MTDDTETEAGRPSKSNTLTAVLGPTPNTWASESHALHAFIAASNALELEGDPRALALRFVGVVAAMNAAKAGTNADVFESTAQMLLNVASDLRRFGWVKGPASLDAANDNTGPGIVGTIVLDVQGR